MQRQSEEALGLLETSDEVTTSIETHGVGVAAKLTERWTTMSIPLRDGTTLEVEGPSPPNFLEHLFTIKDGLTASAVALTVADQKHVHQLAELIGLREEREETRKGVHEKFSITRRVIEDVHGTGKAFVLAGIEGPTARTSAPLLRQVDLAVPRLVDPNLKLSEPKICLLYTF